MTPDVFAEWLRRQGHHVARTSSSYWFNQGPRCYQAFPYHWLIDPPDEELENFLRDNGALALRYSTSLGAATGRLSYHMVYEKPSYGFEDLGKWARKNVRRGLKNCSVEAISFDLLAKEGWSLQEDTLHRQGRSSGLSENKWRNMCDASASLPGFQAWGAFVSGRLAASVITFRLGDWCYMLYQQCRREYLTAHVNNALSFTVTQAMIGRDGVRAILYSLHSLDAPSTMDEFKLRMGYTAKPVRQRVVFHPWAAPLVNRVSHRILKGLAALCPSSGLLAKGQGMVQFCLEGRLPIERQTVPELLALARQDRAPQLNHITHGTD